MTRWKDAPEPIPLDEALLSRAVDCLVTLRKNYEDDTLQWQEVSAVIDEGNAALRGQRRDPAGEDTVSRRAYDELADKYESLLNQLGATDA